MSEDELKRFTRMVNYFGEKSRVAQVRGAFGLKAFLTSRLASPIVPAFHNVQVFGLTVRGRQRRLLCLRLGAAAA